MAYESISTEQLLQQRLTLLSMRLEKHEKEELSMIDGEISEVEKELKARGQKVFTEPKGKVDLSRAIGIEDISSDREDLFLSPSKIKSVRRDLSQVVLSGIELLDKRIIGFNLGELSVWSGSNGSGKSSVISQLAIEAVNQNFKVALYSGELRADRVMNWLQLQAGGRKHAQSTKYENYYTVPESIKSKVNQWLDDKLYIYNNQHGGKVEEVLKSMNDCITNQGVNVVIIDNLMSLDLSSVSGEKYDKQTNLVLALSQLAKKRNVVIHFVAHPRKAIGFLRKTDISGTADITNMADNVFIVHRVNTDFKRAIKEYLGVKDGNPIMNYHNVIEICKNRDLGVSDEFIGLYFERESKRFLNAPGENKRYGWEENESGFMNADEPLPFDD